MAHIFNDSKTFVDMPAKMEITNEIKEEILNQTTQKKLKEVVQKYFHLPGKELVAINITKSAKKPKLFDKIKSPRYKRWASHLCSVWSRLVREMKPEVKENEKRHSLIYLQKPFVVPGGRFRETYYWDTYWSIEGLLQCEMYNITKNILENFVQMVDDIGFVPNGGRKYYKNRSQPPFLTLMFDLYWSHTKDSNFLQRHMKTLVKEYNFWMTYRVVDLNTQQYSRVKGPLKFNIYNSMMGYPRPESYREDVEIMMKAGYENNKTAQREIYSHIASAAESGWDFSSRWFKDKMNMTSIQTRNIIPVDLNSILCCVEYTLGKLFNDVLSDAKTSTYYTQLAKNRQQLIDEFLWNEEYGSWLDYNVQTKKHVKEFYASSFFPLWILAHNSSSLNKTKTNKAFEKFNSLKVFSYVAGLPTSLINSGQQWDFPNAWPPLQHIAVHGLSKVSPDEENDKAKVTATSLAKKFLETAYLSWLSTGHMYEKYDVNERSKAGHGGEYEVQEGFGWTNGVVLNFLNKYGGVLDAPSSGTKKFSSDIVVITFGMVLYFLS